MGWPVVLHGVRVSGAGERSGAGRVRGPYRSRSDFVAGTEWFALTGGRSVSKAPAGRAAKRRKRRREGERWKGALTVCRAAASKREQSQRGTVHERAGVYPFTWAGLSVRRLN